MVTIFIANTDSATMPPPPRSSRLVCLEFSVSLVPCMYDVEESEHTGCVRLVESRSGGAAARK